MNPMACVLSAIVASAVAAPTADIANDPLWNAGALPAGVVAHPAGVIGAVGYAGALAAPAVGVVGAPAVALAAPAVAPVAVAAPAPAISVPAPYTTKAQAPATSSVHAPAPVVTKQVHYGQQQYVAGYNTQVLKPVIPKINIAVPTALKGTHSVTAPIVKQRTEQYVVNEPVHVQKPYNVPYDVVKHVEKVVEVPTPVHVQRPYEVPVPVPVRGADIIKKTVTAPIVKHVHAGTIAHAPVHHGVVDAGVVGYAAAPAIAAGHVAAAPVAAAHAW